MLSAQGPLPERPLLKLGVAVKTSVYVDGLNLYYGALKDTSFKWLDVVELARRVLPQQTVVDRVLYFGASRFRVETGHSRAEVQPAQGK